MEKKGKGDKSLIQFHLKVTKEPSDSVVTYKS